MRKIFLFILIATLIGCKSKKAVNDAKAEKAIIVVNPSDVESVKINRAENLGSRLLDACNTSKLKPFSTEEATEKVIQNATPYKISATCQKINFRNGKFIGLKLIEITYNSFSEEYYFRYAIDYEKKLFKRELFVTINAENKVSAISTKEVKAKPF